MAIAVTLNIEGDALAPTIKDLMASMTPEEKSNLAAKLAFAYFAKDMNTIEQRSYYAGSDRKHADEYMRDLFQTVKGHIAKQFVDDPDLKSKIDEVMATIKPNLAAFVQQAVTSILAEAISNNFKTLAGMQLEIAGLGDKMRQLGQRLGT
jgi:uncharacterized membrane-anchored protein YjiN (DUF445 family)